MKQNEQNKNTERKKERGEKKIQDKKERKNHLMR
jgi:hypothetical protein